MRCRHGEGNSCHWTQICLPERPGCRNALQETHIVAKKYPIALRYIEALAIGDCFFFGIKDIERAVIGGKGVDHDL